VKQGEFEGKVLAHLETLGREMGEVREEIKTQGLAIAAWPGTCSEKQRDLERRVGNGKAKLVVTTATITLGIVGAAVAILKLWK
jgi:ATP-dependent helicase YprA (DUF1998 family)